MGPGRDRTLSPCISAVRYMHLQSDTLSSALRGPLKALSPEMNDSSGVSKVNIIYIRQTLLVSGYPNDPYIFGPPFWRCFGIFSILILDCLRTFSCNFRFASDLYYIGHWVCLPIDRLNSEDVFVK